MEDNARRVTIQDDMVFQRREWFVQRIAWMLTVVLLALALLGAFSTGPLSWSSAETPEGLLNVEYERFARRLGPVETVVSVAPEAARQGEMRVQISQGYIGTVLVQNITPEPSAVIGDAGKQTYVFEVDKTSVPLEVTFRLQPEQMGLKHAEIGLEDTPPVRFWQFVYP